MPRLLDRLRASPRLALLALLLFALKLGTAAACVGHDFIDLGLGASEHGVVVDATPAPAGGGEDAAGTANHATSCSHGSCHQAADIALAPGAFPLAARTTLETSRAATPPAPALRSELRPPIA